MVSEYQSLSSLLNFSYESHPNFGKVSHEFIFDPILIKRFNALYFLVSRRSSSINKKKFTELTDELKLLAVHLFDNAASNECDELRVDFLNELKVEILRCLTQEVEWYGNIFTSRFSLAQDKDSSVTLFDFLSMGFSFGSLKDAEVNQLMMVNDENIRTLKLRAESGENDRLRLTIYEGKSISRSVKLLNKFFSDNGLLDAMSIFFGVNVSVSAIGLELSIPNAPWRSSHINLIDRPPYCEYAHIDESIQHPKAILYLSNVSSKADGPTSIYKGIYESLNISPLKALVGRVIIQVGKNPSSKIFKAYGVKNNQPMSSELFRKHFLALPDELRFHGHFGWDVLPCSLFEKKMSLAEKVFYGKKGDYVAFDGARLVHRGGLVESSPRIAMQVIFSQNSIRKKINTNLSRLRKVFF
jgi:hypothetical protein